MSLMQIQLLSYVIIGFLFGIGFITAQIVYQVFAEIVRGIYANYLVKKLKKTLSKDKPKDLHFGHFGFDKDSKIL